MMMISISTTRLFKELYPCITCHANNVSKTVTKVLRMAFGLTKIGCDPTRSPFSRNKEISGHNEIKTSKNDGRVLKWLKDVQFWKVSSIQRLYKAAEKLNIINNNTSVNVPFEKISWLCVKINSTGQFRIVSLDELAASSPLRKTYEKKENTKLKNEY